MLTKKTSDQFIKFVELLQDGKFHDGTSLGKTLGISPRTIWQIINQLIHYDVSITSQKNKGYQLNEPLILLDKNKLRRLINEKSMMIEIFETLPSTHDYLKAFIDKKKNRLCIAEQQTRGRGRFARNWYSPFGKNIYLSLLYFLAKDVSELAGLSLAVSLSLCKALNKLYPFKHPITIKWPNDLIGDNKKLGGILVEIKAEAHSSSHALIGVGINVNMLEDAEKNVNQQWTSIQKLLHSDQGYQDRNILIASLMNQLIVDLHHFSQHGLQPLLDEWTQYDALFGKTVTIKMNEQEFIGIAKGINERGHLLIKLNETGKVQTFSSGDATIIKK